MFTFTYLRLFTFTSESIQSKIVATMGEAKIKQLLLNMPERNFALNLP